MTDVPADFVSETADNVSEQPSLYPRNAGVLDSPSSHFGESASAHGGTSDMQKLMGLLEDHQKGVNVQVDECRTFVTQSMGKIMDVLEQRVLDNNRQQAQASGGSPLAVRSS
jgi:hypothetical protein